MVILNTIDGIKVVNQSDVAHNIFFVLKQLNIIKDFTIIANGRFTAVTIKGQQYGNL